MSTRMRMSDREKVCAEKWIEAAIDNEDPDLADYWKEQGLEARLLRLTGEQTTVMMPPHRGSLKTCDQCGTSNCENYTCLL